MKRLLACYATRGTGPIPNIPKSRGHNVAVLEPLCAAMNRPPKHQLIVHGRMSQRGADRVGTILAVGAVLAVLVAGVVAVLLAR